MNDLIHMRHGVHDYTCLYDWAKKKIAPITADVWLNNYDLYSLAWITPDTTAYPLNVALPYEFIQGGD